MNNRRNLGLKILIILLLFSFGCKKEDVLNISNGENNFLKFNSEKYSFSFEYPANWEEVKRDLPDRWALIGKNKETILFLVSKPQTKDLLSLGRAQALRDVYDKDQISALKEADLQRVLKIVKLNHINNTTWYSYGIKFSDKNIDSLVSGTLCLDNEIMFVLVSDFSSFDKNKEVYTKILNSFKCD